MYYSVTFNIDGETRNTWDNWKMIPNTPPMIPPPEPNLNYVEIPGRRQGPLDLSWYPNGMTYKRITGSWTFYREPETPTTRIQLYEQLVRYFNGKTGTVILEEEPTHYYIGRFGVQVPRTSIGPIQFTITFDLEPLRYNVSNNAIDSDYADVVYYNQG